MITLFVSLTLKIWTLLRQRIETVIHLKTTYLLGLLIGCLALLPTATFSSQEWNSIESTHFIVYYPEGLTQKASATIDELETYFAAVTKLTGFSPKRTPFILEHTGLSANGFANPVSYKAVVWTAPILSHENFTQYQNWTRLVSLHEFTHLAHMTAVNGAGARSQWVFGRLFSPNIFSPSWMIEGLAVYSESNFLKYEGRLNDAYTNAVIAAKLKDTQLQNPVYLSNTLYSDYPYGSTPYLIGGSFMNYLANEYGPQVIPDIITEYGQHGGGPFIALRPDIGLDAAVKKVTQKSLAQNGNNWINQQKTALQNWNFPKQQETPGTTEKKFLTEHDGLLYYTQTVRQFMEPFRPNIYYEVLAFDPSTKTSTTLYQSTSPIVSPLKFMGGNIVFAVADLQKGYKNARSLTYGQVASVISVDLNSKTAQPLFTKEITCFTFIGQNTWLYVKPSIFSYGSELWTYQYGRHKKLTDLPIYISEINAFRGFLWAVAKKENASWDIYKIDTQSYVPVNITKTPWAETKMYQNGPYLYFNANKDSQQKPYVMNTDSYKIFELSQISYTAFPVELNNTLYFISPTAKGDALFKTTPSPKQTLEWTAPKSEGTSRIPQGTQWSANGTTDSLKKLAPYARFIPPFFLGEDEIGLLDYSLLYTSGGSLVFSLNSKHFVPFLIGGSYIKTQSDTKTLLTLEYPIIEHLTPGLQLLSPYLSQSENDTLIGAQFKLGFPEWSTLGKLEYNTQTSGHLEDITQRFSPGFGTLKLRFANVDNTPFLSQSHIGPDTLIENSSGQLITLDVSTRLFKLRKGNLNPNLGFNDVFLNGYIENNTLDNTTIYGAELITEMTAFFYLNLTPRIGLGLRNDEMLSYFRLDLKL